MTGEDSIEHIGDGRNEAADKDCEHVNVASKPTPAEIATALRRLVAAVDAARSAAEGDFAPDSPAVTDWTANEMPGAWGPQLLQDAYRTAELYGASLRDHVLALAGAIEHGRPFAMASLARAMVEPAARAVWLLEPGILPLERVRRLLNDIMFAAFEHETLWSDEPKVPDNVDILANVKREATTRGLTYTAPVRDPKRGKFKAAQLGDTRPTTQWLLGHATKTPRMAKFFYRAGGAVTHSALHGFDRRLAYSEGPRRRAMVSSVDADAVFQDCTFAMRVYVAYLGALLYQTGWPDEHVLTAIDKAETVWRRIAAEEQDSR